MTQPNLSQQEQLTDHAYDGIQEYDNPIPGWWSWLWIGSIVFGAMYWFVATLSSDMSNEAEFKSHELADMQKNYAVYAAMTADAPTLLKLQTDEKAMALGRAVFLQQCASCHGIEGQGITTAPNLTDDHYKWVKHVDDIPKVVTEGRANNAMPAWGTKMKPEQILVVSAYVASLRGKKAAGNGPYGDVIPAWDAK
jgi:cytochrome c oxidase cbb3-type subunit III